MYVQPRGKDCRDSVYAIFELPAARKLAAILILREL